MVCPMTVTELIGPVGRNYQRHLEVYPVSTPTIELLMAEPVKPFGAAFRWEIPKVPHKRLGFGPGRKRFFALRKELVNKARPNNN